jgi:RHS repeat-associated protein
VHRHGAGATATMTGTYLPCYDGNGNVTELVNWTSATVVSARYEYSPFGETVLLEGEVIAGENPFRFSTKYTDGETGLVYYGYRYYAPELGRWFSKDPIGERGGINLYEMVGNDCTNGIDVLGLTQKRNCKRRSWQFQYQLGATELLKQGFSMFNASGRGSVIFKAEAENCEVCCAETGKWEKTGSAEISGKVDATVNATFGANFRFGGDRYSVSGWAGIRGEASFQVGGHGKIESNPCNGTEEGEICFDVNDNKIKLIGGGQITATWWNTRYELAGVTATASATLSSAKLCFTCTVPREGGQFKCEFKGGGGALEADDAIHLTATFFGHSWEKDWRPPGL